MYILVQRNLQNQTNKNFSTLNPALSKNIWSQTACSSLFFVIARGHWVNSHALVSLVCTFRYWREVFLFVICIYIELLGMLESRNINAGKISTKNFKSQETGWWSNFWKIIWLIIENFWLVPISNHVQSHVSHS